MDEEVHGQNNASFLLHGGGPLSRLQTKKLRKTKQKQKNKIKTTTKIDAYFYTARSAHGHAHEYFFCTCACSCARVCVCVCVFWGAKRGDPPDDLLGQNNFKISKEKGKGHLTKLQTALLLWGQTGYYRVAEYLIFASTTPNASNERCLRLCIVVPRQTLENLRAICIGGCFQSSDKFFVINVERQPPNIGQTNSFPLLLPARHPTISMRSRYQYEYDIPRAVFVVATGGTNKKKKCGNFQTLAISAIDL